MPTILYILLGFLILLIILYLILRRRADAIPNQSQRVDIETVKVSEIKIDSKSSSVIKLDGEKFEKELKKSYDEMVGRL